MMERSFEKSLCLGSGIPFVCLILFISIPNSIVLIVYYKNPLRCFKKSFSVFLIFIAAVDLFNGTVVCFGGAVMRFWCAFGEETVPRDGDNVKILGYIGINSSILLVTAMSMDRFLAVVCPHYYHSKVKPRIILLCNTAIVAFSVMFSLIQLNEHVPIEIYLTIDIHLHTTFPLTLTMLAYLGIFFVLKRRARVGFQLQMIMPNNSDLQEMRRMRTAQMERKFASTSFLILLFIILSLVPYFVAIIIEVNCPSCSNETWFFVLRESCVVFLFINSAVNPLLTALRINELKRSVRAVLHLSRQENLNHSGNCSNQQNTLQINDFSM